MSPEKYVVEIIAPVPGPVQPVAGKIHVKVHVKGRSDVVAVRAQAFRNHPPASPEYNLALGNTPHVYEGDIPAFPAGEFGIKALGVFEGQPLVQVPVEAGPYGVPMGGGGPEQVTIESPAAGPVTLDETAGFEVQVFAQGDADVEEVRAKAYSVGSPAPEWDDLDPLGPHPTSADRYVGTLFGMFVPFRIRAMAKFVGGGTPPPPDDDRGTYSGSES